MVKEELEKILGEHKKWVNGEGGSRAYLSGADLSRADLSDANLNGANLNGADLSRANLSGAYLSRADLSRADLSDANLNGANLSRADLSRADLSGANLNRADLSGAYLSRAYLSDANLSGANLSRADLSGANLSRAYLSDANLNGANLNGAYLSRANLSGTILESINWLIYIGIIPNEKGIAYAYKITNKKGEGKYNGGINYTEKRIFEVPEVDPNLYEQCSFGINLATFKWCLEARADDTERLFLFKFNVKDAVCPIASDGKFRVKRATKIGECDWNGNLMNIGVDR